MTYTSIYLEMVMNRIDLKFQRLLVGNQDLSDASQAPCSRK